MADYQSIYSGEQVDEGISRALTLTRLDGTTMPASGDYIVMAKLENGAYTYAPQLWSTLPAVSATSGSANFFTINNYACSISGNTANFVIDAGRVPYSTTVGDDDTSISQSIYKKISDINSLLNTLNANYVAHTTTCNSNGLEDFTDDNTHFYHISGTAIKRWNSVSTSLTSHITATVSVNDTSRSIHLTADQISILDNSKTHLNDISNATYAYHLKGATERAMLDKWMGDSSVTGSIASLQTQVNSRLKEAFKVSETAPTEHNILWIDSANKVLKYYDENTAAWATVPVAYS